MYTLVAMETACVNTPLGPLKIVGDSSGVTRVSFEKDAKPSDIIPETLRPACEEIHSYFSGNLKTFSSSISPKGSDFQKKVWTELLKIPFGKTVSYQEIANRLGNPKVIRAAASANGKNPIAILIPCHRVIGSDGSLTGYAGGLFRKKWLLEHESPVVQTSLFK